MSNHPDISLSFRGVESAGRLPLAVTRLYRQRLATARVGRPATIGSWMMESCSAPAGEITFLGPGLRSRYPREAGTVNVYAPGCILREDTRRAAIPFRETCLQFSGGEICGLDRLFRPGSRHCLVSDPHRALGALMDEAVECCLARGENAFWRVQSLFCRCVDLLTAYAVRLAADTWEIRPEISPADQFLQAAEAFMRRNIAARIRNADIAAAIGISESGFSHRFRRLAGVSPGARLLDIRVEAARNLLLKGEKLKAIAAATGFSDEFHLSRTFRKRTGLPPREFRRGPG